MQPKNLYLALLFVGSLGCTSDDGNISDELRLEGVEGTVMSTVPCHTQRNGLAYEISIENIESIERIIAPNLPEQYKENGLEIKFDMENSSEGFGACVALYSPVIFYRISNISLKDKTFEE